MLSESGDPLVSCIRAAGRRARDRGRRELGSELRRTKLALAEWRPLTFTATRFIAMALIAVAVLAAQGRLRVLVGPDRRRFALAGLPGFTIYQLGFIAGLDRTSALSSTLLLATIPLFSLLFLRLGGVERVRARQWIGVGLAIGGLALVVLSKHEGPRIGEARLGDGLSLAAAASFALYGIVTRPLGERYPASTVLAGSLLLGSLPLIPLGLFESPTQRWAAVTASGWVIWLYSVVFPVYLGYTWWTAAIAARGVAAIAPYVLLVPLVGGAIAVVWIREPLTAWLAGGAALILLGLALGRDWLPRLIVDREAWARNRRRAIIECAARAPSCSGATLMRGWVKVALVAGGYLAAFLIATAVVAIHVAVTSKDRLGSDGMYAFGDSLFFLTAFGLASIPATGAGLFFLRPFPAFWRRFSTLALIIAATALIALIDYVVAQTVNPNSAFYVWSAFAFLRIIVAPLFALGFFLATIFAPNRSARISLFVATVLEAAAFGGVALRLVLTAITR